MKVMKPSTDFFLVCHIRDPTMVQFILLVVYIIFDLFRF